MSLQEKSNLEINIWLPNEMVAKCDQNSTKLNFGR